jgi:NNP family nitrate/nitrite transporter-like MFS transporter
MESSDDDVVSPGVDQLSDTHNRDTLSSSVITEAKDTDEHAQHDREDAASDEEIISNTSATISADAGDDEAHDFSPRVIVTDGEKSEDLSSVGMSSVVSDLRNARWDEETVTPFSMIPMQLRSSPRRHSWNPSSARPASRWDRHPALVQGCLPHTRRLGDPARHAFPLVLLHDDDEEMKKPDLEAPDLEAPADDNSSTHNSTDTRTPPDLESHASSSSKTPPAPSPYTVLGALDSKYQAYACLVDSSEEDRAVEIQLASFARPHMRAFHLAWMTFFVAFFTWFALTPLLSEVAISLDLTREEIWTSSICGVAGSAVTRLLVGGFNDKYGARWAMAGTLVLSAIPMALTGLVQSGTGLNIVRLFIGLAGSAFVTCQYWTSSMFTREVAGTANALVAGWGNLGGGVTQIVMGSVLFPLFKIIYGGVGWTRAEEPTNPEETVEHYDRPSDLAWRTACVVPALFCFIITYFVIRNADDCPKGNYSKRDREGFMPSVSARKSLMSGLTNLNTWILFVQYGCCFGIEITMINALALYFKEDFGLSTESAAATASIFGWMNLFARGVGGFLSDIANAKWGMRGRLVVQVISLVTEGVLAVVFANMHTLAGAICVMIVFSCFVQAAAGSTFGIVPYVNPGVTGSIAGIVGAGGNVGGVAFAAIFRSNEYRDAFSAMGWAAMSSAVLTVLLLIRGHAGLCCASDAPAVLDRRTSHIEEVGRIPAVRLQDPVENRHNSMQRKNSVSVDVDLSRSSRNTHSQRGTVRVQDTDSSGHAMRVAPIEILPMA